MSLTPFGLFGLSSLSVSMIVLSSYVLLYWTFYSSKSGKTHNVFLFSWNPASLPPQILRLTWCAVGHHLEDADFNHSTTLITFVKSPAVSPPFVLLCF